MRSDQLLREEQSHHLHESVSLFCVEAVSSCGTETGRTVVVDNDVFGILIPNPKPLCSVVKVHNFWCEVPLLHVVLIGLDSRYSLVS